MNSLSFITLIILTSFLCACSNDAMDQENENKNEHLSLSNTKTELPLEQFVKWVGEKDHDLSKTKDISEMSYHLSYMPKECMAYMELNKPNYTNEELEAVLNHYKEMTYFNFRIELKQAQGEILKYNLTSAQQYNERINYVSFQMQNDIYLVQGNDTLIPGLYHFERTFDVAPFMTVMLAFDNKKFNPEDEFTIVYNDKLFNKGFIKYNYKPKQLIDLPNLSGV